MQSRAGQLEQAAGGTLFLDEVAEMATNVQAKFLRELRNILERAAFLTDGGLIVAEHLAFRSPPLEKLKRYGLEYPSRSSALPSFGRRHSHLGSPALPDNLASIL